MADPRRGRATLVVLPGPSIPFAGCRYYQRVEIDLADDASLTWGAPLARGALSAATLQNGFALSY